MTSDLLKNKTVWIVGAAGAIGHATALRFTMCGAAVVLSGRNEDSLRRLADELESLDMTRPSVVPVDITNRESVDFGAQAAISALGKVDTLINSTTNPIFADFMDLTDEDWMAVMDAKAFGYMRTARAILPHFRMNGGGAIINVSGRGGHQPTSPAHLAGSLANGAVNTLTKGLANLYGDEGIRVNAVAPGPVESERYNRISQANQLVSDTMNLKPKPGAGTDNTLGYMSAPNDIADAIVFLASDMSRFLTGETLRVDGGGTVAM